MSVFSEAEIGTSCEVLSKRLVVQSVRLFGKSEETAQVEEEMNGHGRGSVYPLWFVSREISWMSVVTVALGVVWMGEA